MSQNARRMLLRTLYTNATCDLLSLYPYRLPYIITLSISLNAMSTNRLSWKVDTRVASP